MNKFLIAIASLFLWACNNATTSSETDVNKRDQAYIDSVEKVRKQKHVEFKVAKNSPFYKHKNFKELSYYPVTKAYRFWVKLHKLAQPELVQFVTSGSRQPVYQKVCFLSFSMGTELPDTLWGFVQSSHPSVLFVPFKDLTNNETTYGGGRYLELDYSPQMDSIYLDFNFAFNPYCHYDTGYSCPVVPFENHLKREINAGEKRYPYAK
jgi:uncharacterized protein (DUF1684 family)